ncbi:hypothetical protein OS176_12455 [Xanthomonadaceae bacterium XH05]|nr:hypothetical protein [Xanthomonadaceae bacterium XH05]
MDLRREIVDTVQRALPSGSRLTRTQWGILAIAAGAGAMLWLGTLVFAGSRSLPAAFGLFLLTYVGVVAAGSLPDEWISRRLDRVLDRWVRDESGGGFYGMVALSVFVGLEVESLFDPEAGLFSGWDFVEGQIVQVLIGFSADSLKNMVMASIWPWPMISRVGLLSAGVFVAACWGAFMLGRAWLPMPDLTKKAGADGSGPEGNVTDDGQ